MGKIKKQPRWLEEEGSSSSSAADHLSSLPENLRFHILTLLPLKYAIRTGILSSQWRDIWMRRWPHPPSHLRLSSLPGPITPSFIRLVDESLASSQTLDSLDLSLGFGFDHFVDIQRWLRRAEDLGVEDLTLSIVNLYSLDLAYDLPRTLYRLTIAGVQLPSPSYKYLNLSSLEVLNLHDVSVYDEALTRIVSGCYLLKTLNLRRCRELKKLVIHDTGLWLRSVTVVDCPNVLKIKIEASTLTKFHFIGEFCTKYKMNLDLEDVCMSCAGKEPMMMEASNWWDLLGWLRYVRVFTLCSVSLRYIANCGEHRSFRYLKELQVLMLSMESHNLMDICCFFKFCHCPGLEKLFIELPAETFTDLEKLVSVDEQPPAGSFTNLKMIKVRGFKGHKCEMLLVRILLWKAVCLESLVIITQQSDVRGKYNTNVVNCHPYPLHLLRLELSLMTKLSKNAKIVVKDHDDYRVRPTHDDVYSKV